MSYVEFYINYLLKLSVQSKPPRRRGGYISSEKKNISHDINNSGDEQRPGCNQTIPRTFVDHLWLNWLEPIMLAEPPYDHDTDDDEDDAEQNNKPPDERPATFSALTFQP